MALISGGALLLLAGSALPADAAAGMRFYSTAGWFMGGMNVPVRKHRATTVKREKSEPNKETGFGEMPKGPLQLVVSINTQKVTLFSNGVRVAQGPVSTGGARPSHADGRLQRDREGPLSSLQHL